MHFVNKSDALLNKNNDSNSFITSRAADTMTFSKRHSTKSGFLSDYQTIEDVVQALTAFSQPPSLATSWSGTNSNDSKPLLSASNPLTCLFDSNNIANFGSNKGCIKSFIPERGINNINNYQGVIVDERNNMIMVECCYSFCEIKRPLFEARRQFKSCHHCYTYYCCYQCRQQDWNNHKMTICPIGRTSSALKSVIRKLLSDKTVHNTFSNLGLGGFLRMGRGCVVIMFSSCFDAETFAQHGIGYLKNYPVFVCIKNVYLLSSQFVPDSVTSIRDACDKYNPNTSFVINVAITMDKRLLKMCSAMTRHYKVHALKRCVTIPLSEGFVIHSQQSVLSESFDNCHQTSLLMTMLPSQQNHNSLNYEDRQIIFINILRKLESKGVDLKKQYPKVYRNLSAFVENLSDFPPTTIYPTDISTGKPFICVIAPHTEPFLPLGKFDNIPSNRSSIGSFMAELDALKSDWKLSEITDL